MKRKLSVILLLFTLSIFGNFKDKFQQKSYMYQSESSIIRESKSEKSNEYISISQLDNQTFLKTDHNNKDNQGSSNYLSFEFSPLMKIVGFNECVIDIRYKIYFIYTILERDAKRVLRN